MKDRLYEFDPVIYPTRLWVSICPSFEKLDKQFYFLNEDGEVVDNARDEFNKHMSAVATTFPVAHRKSGWKGCFVVIWRQKDCGAGICAHEATHVVDWISDELGIGGYSFLDGEARAYLAQWVVNNIDKVLRGRV